MITVSIFINNKPVFTRTAVNRTDEYYKKHPTKKRKSGAYLVDNGEWLFHQSKDGAVKLAMQMLKTIKEVK